MSEFISLEYGEIPNYNGKWLSHDKAYLSPDNLAEVLNILFEYIKPTRKTITHTDKGVLIEVEY